MHAPSDNGQPIDTAGQSPLTGAAWLDTSAKQGSLVNRKFCPRNDGKMGTRLR